MLLHARRHVSSRHVARLSARLPAVHVRPLSSVNRTFQGAEAAAATGITQLGIQNPSTIFRNLSYPELAEHEDRKKEGKFTSHGNCFAVDTGIFTGRSPKDKWIVKNVGSESDENLWWGSVNQPMKPEVFDELYEKAIAHFNTLDECYVFDGFCGANKASQKRVRFVHEMAWQQVRAAHRPLALILALYRPPSN